jgi:hypothetical protein
MRLAVCESGRVRLRSLAASIPSYKFSSTVEEMQEPPNTRFGNELRAFQAALERLERERLKSAAPTDLDSAADALDRQIAALDREMGQDPVDADRLLQASGRLVCVVADLLAAVVASDEGRVARFPVPLTSAPPMIETFDESLKVPVDLAVAAWRDGEKAAPLELWRYQLGIHLDAARQGVAMSSVGTTVYVDSRQSNQSPIVGLLAHCLSLWTWLQRD